MTQDTPDDTNRLRTLLAARKRLLIVVVVVGIAVTGAGVVLAEETAVMDDFEDNDMDPILEEWGNWTEGVITSNALEGTYSAFRGTTASEVVGRSQRNNRTQITTLTYEMNATFVDSTSSDYAALNLQNSTVGRITDIEFHSGGAITINDTTEGSWSEDDHYRVIFENIDYSSNTYDVRVLNMTAGGVEVFELSGVNFETANNNANQITMNLKANTGLDTDHGEIIWDNVTVAVETTPTYRLYGYVRDAGTNQGLNNSNITIENSSGIVETININTDDGFYESDLANGTYNVTANRTGYFNETKEVTIDGDRERVDFYLENRSAALEFEVNQCLEHNQFDYYSATFVNQTADGENRTDVTDTISVSSNDTTLITVEEDENLIQATNDTNLNGTVWVNATYTAGNGETFEGNRQVTVAAFTVENLGELDCAWTRVEVSMSDSNLFVILLATLIGVTVSLIATVFAGVSAVTGVIVVGWIMNAVDDGIVIVAVLMGAWIGMNVAGQIDYQINRGG